MLGIVGDLQTLLLSEWPEAIEWSNSLNVWPEEGGPRNRYRGEDCNILLKNVDDLELLAVLENKLDSVKPIIHTYRSLNKVKKACFGRELDPDYVEILNEYWSNVRKLNRIFGFSITPKVHISYWHVKKWCGDNKIGLGRHSEGPHESIHSKFIKVWNRRKVRKGNPRFRKVLRKAAVYLNSNADIEN